MVKTTPRVLLIDDDPFEYYMLQRDFLDIFFLWLPNVFYAESFLDLYNDENKDLKPKVVLMDINGTSLIRDHDRFYKKYGENFNIIFCSSVFNSKYNKDYNFLEKGKDLNNWIQTNFLK